MSLDKNFIEESQKKLLDEKRRIEEDLERFAKPTDAPGEYETTFGDQGTDEDENASEVEEYTDNLALENSLEKQLKEIHEALARIDDGTYGYCENCQKEIDTDRLKAYPAAKTCINCN
ncbi:MAG: Transcriptional regulator, TraR/DksA family [Candidatus Moranbacteria bacterium GW2011_GWE1_49_15]|nr:MAG: Transcriptional regulator, TraR/DksA family [Candidatus Moranbacteria bacterium GW2011_GWE2_47_10]KKW07335.1 MAG: Transcriptional regulator, TraR/DksA family [Candidatus Moranbacteria bacterium GW2011_GWE1_49_15]HBP00839.1 hypothetical protein [Candidatus Moranbacteria bacterium]